MSHTPEELATRYQHQPAWVKACRWARWRPLYFALACLNVAAWVLMGCRPVEWMNNDGVVTDRETRLSSLWMTWHLTNQRAETKMQHYYTLEECLRR